jgi:hypothetical protein
MPNVLEFFCSDLIFFFLLVDDTAKQHGAIVPELREGLRVVYVTEPYMRMKIDGCLLKRVSLAACCLFHARLFCRMVSCYFCQDHVM